MSLLLIWEVIPDSVEAYVLDGHEADLARDSAGLYINHDDTEGHAIEELCALLSDRASLDASEPIKGAFDEVVICGFVL